MEILTSLLPREVRAPVAVAGVLVSGALFEFIPELGGRPRLEPGISLAGALPPSRPPVPVRATPAGPASQAAHQDPLSLDEFIGLLEKKTPPPVAREFAKAFMKEPSLRKVWDEHKRSRGGRGPARDFLKQVASLPRFRQLANQFKSQPGSQAAFAQLARDPGVGEALRDAVGGGAAVAGASSNPAGRPPTFDEARNTALQGASAAARQSAAVTQNRPGLPGADSRSSSFLAAATLPGGARDAGSLITGAAAAGASTTGSGSLSQGSADPGEARGSEEDAVTDLRTLSTAGDSRDAASYLDGIFATAPAWLRETLKAQCEADDDLCDPIDACMAADVYDACVEACRANPACGGQIASIFPGEADQPAVEKSLEKTGATDDTWIVPPLAGPDSGNSGGPGSVQEPPPADAPPDPPGLFESLLTWFGNNMPIFGGDGLAKMLGNAGEAADNFLELITP